MLAANGLIGKLHLESMWSQEEVFSEIRSVLQDVIENDAHFPFKILLSIGSGTKCLAIPSLSGTYKWTQREVAGRADTCIYILVEKDLKNEVHIQLYHTGTVML